MSAALSRRARDPHAIWKGAISFGLVHIPVALYPAASESGVDFDWLDKRSMDPVGYRRVNKRTGREIAREQIVKGVKVGDGKYVVIGEDEIKAAYPKTTQTVAIEAFVSAGEIPFTQLEKPYYLEPLAKGERVYALLREAMRDAGVIGIARVVMHTKEHLAALVPSGPALVLNTLRWADDIRSMKDLKLPSEGSKASELKPNELKMAKNLIAEMTQTFRPDRYADTFTAAVGALVKKRTAAGKTEQVEPMEEDAPPQSGNVVELTELLRKSLGHTKANAAHPVLKHKTVARKAPARKRA